MKRQKFGGRTQGTPNAKNAHIRDLMRQYVIDEFQYLQANLHQLTLADRAALFRALARYGIAPLAPEIEVNHSDAPVSGYIFWSNAQKTYGHPINLSRNQF
jgi:hypothetical protein